MKKLLLLLGVIFCVGNVVHAYDLGYQNLVYNIINESTHEVEVTYVEDGRGNADFYTGDITIPPKFLKDGVIYQVTSIGNQAFWRCSGLTSVNIDRTQPLSTMTTRTPSFFLTYEQ